MNARSLCLAFMFLLLSCVSLVSLDLTSSRSAIAQSAVTTAMEQIADWQITALGTSQDEGWATATFFDGLLALYHVTGDSQYFNRAVSWGTANNWTPASPQSNPNNQNAGQAFLETFLIQHSVDQLTPTQKVINAVMAQGGTGQQVWWWEDSLFMAPPTFSRLGAATGTASYFNFMDAWYWEVVNYLLDPTTNLLWRDSSFFGKTCPNGQKMFWSRGNAWVIAGLVRVLEFLPANYPDRSKFVSLLQNMAAAILPLQRSDGYWSSCLTDTTDYPEPETSGTAGFVYALAWAINNGILDPNTYAPVVRSGWNAIVNAIQPSGALGWVQPGGDQPGPSSASDSFAFGTGLALLAGSEVAKMNEAIVTLTPIAGPLGSTVAVSGSNFNPSDTSCTISGSPVSSPTCSVSSGVVAGSFVVPNVASGTYSLTVTGSPTGDFVSTSFTVTSTYSETFAENNIPSGVTWGVTVGGVHQSTGSSTSLVVNGLTGTVSYSYDSPVSGSGGSYTCASGCSSSVSGAGTVTATYTFTQTETISVSTAMTSYAQGQSIQYNASGFIPGDAVSSCLTTNDVAYAGVCVGQANADSNGNAVGSMFVGTNIPVGPQMFWVADTSRNPHINSNSVQLTITSSAFTMTVSYSVVGGGSPTPPVFYYVLNSVPKSLTLTKTTNAVSVDVGTTWFVSPNPLTGSSSSQRWYSTQSLSGTASTTTIVFAFQHQYYLTMKVSSSTAGSVTPSSGWQNAGVTITVKATAKTGHTFKSWTGSGTGSYTGTSATHTITMNSAITETATFT